MGIEGFGYKEKGGNTPAGLSGVAGEIRHLVRLLLGSRRHRLEGS